MNKIVECFHNYVRHKTAMGTKCERCTICGKLVIRNKITARTK